MPKNYEDRHSYYRHANYQRIVIKLGTSTLTAGSHHLSPARIVEIVRQIAQLHIGNAEVILVSSGAMAAGREKLAFPQLPKEIPVKQMLAAIGQPRQVAARHVWESMAWREGGFYGHSSAIHVIGGMSSDC